MSTAVVLPLRCVALLPLFNTMVLPNNGRCVGTVDARKYITLCALMRVNMYCFMRIIQN